MAPGNTPGVYGHSTGPYRASRIPASEIGQPGGGLTDP
jgi:hypothetical protein